MTPPQQYSYPAMAAFQDTATSPEITKPAAVPVNPYEVAARLSNPVFNQAAARQQAYQPQTGNLYGYNQNYSQQSYNQSTNYSQAYQQYQTSYQTQMGNQSTQYQQSGYFTQPQLHNQMINQQQNTMPLAAPTNNANYYSSQPQASWSSTVYQATNNYAYQQQAAVPHTQNQQFYYQQQAATIPASTQQQMPSTPVTAASDSTQHLAAAPVQQETLVTPAQQQPLATPVSQQPLATPVLEQQVSPAPSETSPEQPASVASQPVPDFASPDQESSPVSSYPVSSLTEASKDLQDLLNELDVYSCGTGAHTEDFTLDELLMFN